MSEKLTTDERNKIDIHDFGGWFAQTYQEKCVCGNITEVSSQNDDNTEYQISVFVKCQCGESVEFLLPVN